MLFYMGMKCGSLALRGEHRPTGTHVPRTMNHISIRKARYPEESDRSAGEDTWA